MKGKAVTMMKRAFLLAAALCGVVSCSPVKPDPLYGNWIQPIPGQDGWQGISLDRGGNAQSINMHTLAYTGWKREGDRLILRSRSIGNYLTTEQNETMVIRKLTADELVLSSEDGSRTETYKRGNG